MIFLFSWCAHIRFFSIKWERRKILPDFFLLWGQKWSFLTQEIDQQWEQKRTKKSIKRYLFILFFRFLGKSDETNLVFTFLFLPSWPDLFRGDRSVNGNQLCRPFNSTSPHVSRKSKKTAKNIEKQEKRSKERKNWDQLWGWPPLVEVFSLATFFRSVFTSKLSASHLIFRSTFIFENFVSYESIFSKKCQWAIPGNLHCQTAEPAIQPSWPSHCWSLSGLQASPGWPFRSLCCSRRKRFIILP